jgi:outer membrane protein
MDDIKNAVANIARTRGANLVLDKGGPTLIGTPALVYSDASYDITDDVLKDLNKDRPAPATPAPAATASPTTPAATAPATFSVPNVTNPAKPDQKKP